MVTRGNRASGEEKQTILNFMAGNWKKRAKGGDGCGGGETGVRTFLVSEGNESLKTDEGDPRVVHVETYFNLNYSTGKLDVKKMWKPV